MVMDSLITMKTNRVNTLENQVILVRLLKMLLIKGNYIGFDPEYV